ncbi:hypothetical protein [Lacinutrix chionoecetis]
MSKVKTAFSMFGNILLAFWKLFLLGVYCTSKIIEGLAKLVGKITEKYID